MRRNRTIFFMETKGDINMPINYQAIFDAAYENDVATLQQLIEEAGDEFDLTKTYSSRFEGVTTMFSQVGYYVKKTTASVVGGCTGVLAPIGMIAEGTIDSLTGGTCFILTAAAVLLWKSGDKALLKRYYNKNGWTALHFAMFGDSSEAAVYLLEKCLEQGIDIIQADVNPSCWKIALEMKNIKVVMACIKFLLERTVQETANAANAYQDKGAVQAQLYAILAQIRGFDFQGELEKAEESEGAEIFLPH